MIILSVCLRGRYNDLPDFSLSFRSFSREYIVNYSEITSYWYRRGHLNLKYRNSSIDSYSKRNYLDKEKQHVNSFLDFALKIKNHINSFDDNKINKLNTLLVAKQVGLKVPNTFLSRNISLLNEKISKGPTITKAIYCGSYYEQVNNNFIGSGTNFIKNSNIKDILFYSLIQDGIEKKYELRIFYLKEKIWATAIFSQNDLKTKIDFRNYNKERPNRSVPYKLPENLCSQIILLMKTLNINSGSIDILVNKASEYIFLEVNPIGQFQSVSYSNNYFLEKEIAINLY